MLNFDFFPALLGALLAFMPALLGIRLIHRKRRRLLSLPTFEQYRVPETGKANCKKCGADRTRLVESYFVRVHQCMRCGKKLYRP